MYLSKAKKILTSKIDWLETVCRIFFCCAGSYLQELPRGKAHYVFLRWSRLQPRDIFRQRFLQEYATLYHQQLRLHRKGMRTKC